MTATLVFDINETLLDLDALNAPFEHYFGNAALRKEWFNQVLRGGMTATMIGAYRNFTDAGAAALDILARLHEIDLDQVARQEILGTMRKLPAHADVKPGLERLSKCGYPLAALTNSVLDTAEEQLHQAGIASYFDKILSADTAGVLKPAAKVYRDAWTALDIEPGEMWMVAAHDWDIAGAMEAGCRGVFIARPGMTTSPLFKDPDLVVSGLEGLADRLEQQPLS